MSNDIIEYLEVILARAKQEGPLDAAILIIARQDEHGLMVTVEKSPMSDRVYALMLRTAAEPIMDSETLQ